MTTRSHSMIRRWSYRRFVPVTEIELRAIFSEGRALVSSLLLEPVVQFLLLAAGIQGLIAAGDDFYNGHSYQAFVLPGLIALQALRGFSRTMYRMVLDRQWGMLTIKLLAGTGGAGYAIAKMMAPALAFLVQMAVLIALGFATGLRFSFENLMLTAALGLIAIAFWAALAIIITAYVRDYVLRDMVVTWMMLPLSLAAPVFYSLDTAPAYLQWIGKFNPLAWQVESLRAALLDGEISGSAIWLSLPTLVVVLGAVVSVTRGDALASEGGR